MIGKIPRLATMMLVASAVLVGTAGMASAAEVKVIYNNVSNPLPKDMENERFEGSVGTGELGGQVAFEPGKWKNPKVSFALVSHACQSGTQAEHNCATSAGAKFEWPIRFSIYEVASGNAVGEKIATGTKTFQIPYRPSASSKCTGAQEGDWYTMGKCFAGKAIKLTLGLKVHQLPAEAIVSVAFNTSGYGAEPQAPQPCNTSSSGCPYDFLGVGLTEPPAVPSVGTNPLPNSGYINAAHEACWEGNTLGTFSLSTGSCWEGYQPLIEVKATAG